MRDGVHSKLHIYPCVGYFTSPGIDTVEKGPTAFTSPGMDTLEKGPTAFTVTYEGRRQCAVNEISQVTKWQYVVSIPGPLDRKSDRLPHNHLASLKNKHNLDVLNHWLDPMANTVTSRDNYNRDKGRQTSVRAFNDLKK